MLFVYGTLRSEFDNEYARLLRSKSKLVGRATVPGSIFRIGSRQSFPGWKPEPAGEVHGELYRLTDPETILKALDEYEGPDFDRVVVKDAWIYRYNKQPPKYSRIASGDFCAP
jgi:gamma-glutamylcyclotransferase (GGCT)/AIG2-like uncharacterized protein YtfP